MFHYWTAWLALAFGAFVAGEAYALVFRGMTLTHWVREVSKSYPFFPWLVLALAIVLPVHFWFE